MAKPTGLPKTGGRSKGTPNKKSQFLSDAFETQGIDVATELAQIYKESLCASDRLQILFKLLEYCYPKKKSVEHIVPSEENKPSNMDFDVLTDKELDSVIKLLSKTGGLPT